jgi:UPF0042 nucleotide-binding protein
MAKRSAPKTESPGEASLRPGRSPELVIITGLSGSGKGTVLKALEDLGYYAVDHLPLDLIQTFAELTKDSPNIRRAALVVDIREGEYLARFPEIYQRVRRKLRTRLLFLDAADDTLVRRYSETRRPHPLSEERTLRRSVQRERELLDPIKTLADHVLMTDATNVHELKKRVGELFSEESSSGLNISVISFGFKHGVPQEADIVLDVRFLPNPNYIPELKRFTGKNARVARFVRSFPQTAVFFEKTQDMLGFLIPHYVQEGKSYLTIAFGCTGGHHRSVMMAEETGAWLQRAGFNTRIHHRDIKKGL